MKRYYLFGFFSGLALATLIVLGFWKYYVFPEARERRVAVDGLKDNFSLEQISEVNSILENLPGGRRAVVYPTSGSSYVIVWLPKNSGDMSEEEQRGISGMVRDKLLGLHSR